MNIETGKVVGNTQPMGVEGLDISYAEACAYAVLFAVAPDLLKALKKIAKHEKGCKKRNIGYDITVDNIATEAITKVEVENE